MSGDAQIDRVWDPVEQEYTTISLALQWVYALAATAGDEKATKSAIIKAGITNLPLKARRLMI